MKGSEHMFLIVMSIGHLAQHCSNTMQRYHSVKSATVSDLRSIREE